PPLLSSRPPPPPSSPLFPYTTLFRSRRTPESGHGADTRLIHALPSAARPHEGLVVEARGDQRRGKAICGGQIEGKRWPTVLAFRSEEHTSELQSRENLVCRLLLEKKK